MKIKLKGHYFIATGCEHGPTLMYWNDEFKFDQKLLDFFEEISFCSNRFYSRDVFSYGCLAPGMFDYINEVYPDNIKEIRKYNGYSILELKKPFCSEVEFDIEWEAK